MISESQQHCSLQELHREGPQDSPEGEGSDGRRQRPICSGEGFKEET